MSDSLHTAFIKDRRLVSGTDFSGIYGSRHLTDDELRRHGYNTESISCFRGMENSEGRPGSPIVDPTDSLMDLMIGSLQVTGPKAEAVLAEFLAAGGIDVDDDKLDNWADQLSKAKAEDLNDRVRAAYEEIGQQAPPDALWHVQRSNL